MDTTYRNLAHRAGAKEIDGIKDGSDKVQAYAGLVVPVVCSTGIAQKKIVYSTDDEDGDESAKLPLHQWQRDGLSAHETHQFINHQR